MSSRSFRYFLVAVVTVAAAGGVFASRSFSAASTTVSALAKETHFHGIAVDPSDSSRAYLATHNGLYVIAPDGSVDKISATTDDFMGFTPHPADPDVLYASGHPAGGGNLGLIVSKDRGRTWQTAGQGAHGPSDFHQMTISPVDSRIIFGIYGTDLQVSRDGGQIWEVVSQIPDRIFSVAASARNRDGLYAASAGGLLYSTDGGQSWAQLTAAEKPVTMVATTTEGRVFIFVMGEGLLQAREPDLDWQLVSNDFGGAYMLHLAVGAKESGKLYAVTVNPETRGQAVVMSDDNGAAWVSLGGN